MSFRWLTLLGAVGTALASASFPDFAGAPGLGRAFDRLVASPPTTGFGGAAYDDGLFSPVVESLGELRDDAFTTLRHPVYPNHGVRIKKSQFCDEGVKCV
jgi:hypothetical protein